MSLFFYQLYRKVVKEEYARLLRAVKGGKSDHNPSRTDSGNAKS